MWSFLLFLFSTTSILLPCKFITTSTEVQRLNRSQDVSFASVQALRQGRLGPGGVESKMARITRQWQDCGVDTCAPKAYSGVSRDEDQAK